MNFYKKLKLAQVKLQGLPVNPEKSKFIFSDKDAQWVSYSVDENDKYIILSKIFVE